MKIDYDKSVKGELPDGFYWARFVSDGYPDRVDMACVISGTCVMHHWSDHGKRFPHCRETVDAWRTIGWQFYRARLPKPAPRRARRA